MQDSGHYWFSIATSNIVSTGSAVSLLQAEPSDDAWQDFEELINQAGRWAAIATVKEPTLHRSSVLTGHETVAFAEDSILPYPCLHSSLAFSSVSLV